MHASTVDMLAVTAANAGGIVYRTHDITGLTFGYLRDGIPYTFTLPNAANLLVIIDPAHAQVGVDHDPPRQPPATPR